MNRKEARKIAEKITNEEIFDMFEEAKAKINDWTIRSANNIGLSKGTAWNILAKNFDITIKYHVLAKTNMISEFGDYLPEKLKPKRRKKMILKKPSHQDPIF